MNLAGSAIAFSNEMSRSISTDNLPSSFGLGEKARENGSLLSIVAIPTTFQLRKRPDFLYFKND